MVKWISDLIRMIFPSLVKNKEVENQKPIEESVTETPEKEPIEEEVKPKENPNKNSLILFRPGHGKNTKGKQTPDGVKEYELNKPIAEKAVVYAKSLGFEALIANDYDYEDPNPNKALTKGNEIINKITRKAWEEGKEVICISNHCNAHQPNFPKEEWTNASGTVTFFWQRKIKKVITGSSKEGEKLAIAIHKEMVKATGLMDRAFSFDRSEALGKNFKQLRGTICPTALVECAFMTNREDADFLKSDEGQDICAKAMVDGAFSYFQNK